MTKHNPEAFQTSHRPAILRGGEGLDESLNRLADRLSKISHKWENRLAFDKIVFPEDYASGRVTIGLHLRRRVGHWSKNTEQGGYVRSNDNGVFENYAANTNFPGRDLLPRENDKIVLLPVGKSIYDGESFISTIGKIDMRAYTVGDKANGGGERLTYEGFRGRFPHAFFVIPDGHRQLLLDAGRSTEAHPTIVEGGPQAVHRIAEDKGYLFGSLLRPSETDAPDSVTVRICHGQIEVRLDPMSMQTFQVVDVLVGPFDLQ